MKMKKIIIYAIAITIGLGSCNLDKEPLSDIGIEAYFKTESDLQMFSNTFYNNLLEKKPYEKQSDLYVQQKLTDELIGGSKRQVPNSKSGWEWSDLRKMNTLIEYAPQCEDANAVVKYTALARFFRAFFYFEKVKRFGDVPWYDTQLASNDPRLYNPRDSREFIMTKMLEDIDYAIANSPSAVSTYRVNKWTALALKAQFCLYEGTYRKYHNINLDGHDYKYYLEQSAEAAKELLDKGPYKLYSTGKPDVDYLMLFAQENASKDEYILSIKFDHVLGIRHNATAHTVLATQGRPGLTRKMINSYLMADGKRFTDKADWQQMEFVNEVKDRDPRLSQSIRTLNYSRLDTTAIQAPDLNMSVTGYQPIKFVQGVKAANGQIDRPDMSTCDLPVYRLAEVMLNYAEAKAELGTLSQEDLNISVNKIRARVGMPILEMDKANANPDWYLSSPEYGYTNVNGANKGVILEIRRERAIELTQENFRFDDLVRWKSGASINQDIKGMYFPGPGQYDLTGDAKPDVILYEKNTPKPKPGAGVQVLMIGEDILLSDGNRGYVDYHKNLPRTNFSEVRDYLYPIPINERSLNKNLTQNPGWNDGLGF